MKKAPLHIPDELLSPISELSAYLPVKTVHMPTIAQMTRDDWRKWEREFDDAVYGEVARDLGLS